MLYVAHSVLLGVCSTFVIANVSFYYFSAYFAAFRANLYVASVARYWPQYLLTTGVYVGCSLLPLFIRAGIRTLSGSSISSNKNSP